MNYEYNFVFDLSFYVNSLSLKNANASPIADLTFTGITRVLLGYFLLKSLFSKYMNRLIHHVLMIIGLI